jgi:hypothetical protein
MDPSTASAQNVQDQTGVQQPADQVQQPVAVQQPPAPSQPKGTTTISVGGGKETAPAVIVQESAEEDDEDEIQPAPQEIKANVVTQQGGADTQEEVVELQPAVPEVVTSSSEVEAVIEKTPDQEKPALSEEVKKVGLTHSGPGVIAVEQENSFGITKMPITYAQAADEEKKTNITQSKHWLMGVIMYVWRKVNPTLGKDQKVEKKIVATK